MGGGGSVSGGRSLSGWVALVRLLWGVLGGGGWMALSDCWGKRCSLLRTLVFGPRAGRYLGGKETQESVLSYCRLGMGLRRTNPSSTATAQTEVPMLGHLRLSGKRHSQTTSRGALHCCLDLSQRIHHIEGPMALERPFGLPPYGCIHNSGPPLDLR